MSRLWRTIDRVTDYRPTITGRRIIYLFFSVATIIIYFGFVSGYPMLSGRITPIIWAAPAGFCFCAGIRPTSRTLWATSGVAALAAVTSRAVTIVYYDITDRPGPTSVDGFATIAVAVYAIAWVGIICIWGQWLKLRGE